MQGKTPLRSPPHVTRTGARVAEAEEGLLVALAPVLPARPLVLDGIADISFHGGGQLSHGYTNFTCGQCRVDWCAVQY